jgi:hypothetical protein
MKSKSFVTPMALLALILASIAYANPPKQQVLNAEDIDPAIATVVWSK